MRTIRAIVATLAVPAAAAGLAALTLTVPGDAAPAAPGPTPEAAAADATPAVQGTWRIEATGARIIGGYGDNFDYAGDDVRPLDGRATMTVDAEAGRARLEIRVSTTEASGPIRFSKDRSFEGEIHIVQRIDTSRMDQARVVEEMFLHGDTGNEAPVMPRVWNYFATWGPASITVDGREAVPMIGSHTMFSEQARGSDGRIVNDAGEIYSPRVPDKTGFTEPTETEFHFVAHTTEPDPDNFPPHTAWIHLHFSDVQVVEKPADVELPYATD